MRKASTQKAAAPVNLGTKRACTKCGTKFYDFGKTDLQCPKCRHKMTLEEIESKVFIEPKKKVEKPSTALADEEETAVESGDGFESIEDLDDDDDVTEDVEVDEDDDKEKY